MPFVAVMSPLVADKVFLVNVQFQYRSFGDLGLGAGVVGGGRYDASITVISL